ncbi:hypothetical protein LCGC14_2828840, partial [marine sediment metagenome]
MSEKTVGIVILSYNTGSYAEQCLASLKKYHKDLDYKVFLVNNGCDDYNTKILEKIPKIHVYIKNEKNKGYSRGVNQGLYEAMKENCDYYLLLNDDTLFTESCIDKLIETMENNERVGMVSTMTNYASHKHQDVKHWGGKPHGKIMETHVLLTVCVLLSKDLIRKVGVLDENFNLGGYDDNDISLRARIAGFKLLVDGRTFIFHYGSVANKLLPTNYWHNLERNKAYFEKKWEMKNEDPDWQSKFFDMSTSGK